MSPPPPPPAGSLEPLTDKLLTRLCCVPSSASMSPVTPTPHHSFNKVPCPSLLLLGLRLLLLLDDHVERASHLGVLQVHTAWQTHIHALVQGDGSVACIGHWEARSCNLVNIASCQALLCHARSPGSHSTGCCLQAGTFRMWVCHSVKLSAPLNGKTPPVLRPAQATSPTQAPPPPYHLTTQPLRTQLTSLTEHSNVPSVLISGTTSSLSARLRPVCW